MCGLVHPRAGASPGAGAPAIDLDRRARGPTDSALDGQRLRTDGHVLACVLGELSL